MYATNNDINTVCDFYESAFKNFEKLETTRNEMADITPERMQFMASKGNSMLNFAYKDKEKSASFEYHK